MEHVFAVAVKLGNYLSVFERAKTKSAVEVFFLVWFGEKPHTQTFAGVPYFSSSILTFYEKAFIETLLLNLVLSRAMDIQKVGNENVGVIYLKNTGYYLGRYLNGTLFSATRCELEVIIASRKLDKQVEKVRHNDYDQDDGHLGLHDPEEVLDEFTKSPVGIVRPMNKVLAKEEQRCQQDN